MQESKKFAFDVGWIFGSTAFVSILGFINKPIMAYYIGANGLGLWAMLFAIASLFGVTNLGIPAATTKYVAEYKDDENRLNKIISASLIISLLLGIITTIVLFLVADTVTGIFDMPLLTPLFKLFILAIPFSYLSGSILAILKGLRKMKLVSLLTSTSQFLNFGLIIIPIIFGYGLKGAVSGYIVATVVSMLISIFFSMDILHLTFFGFKETTKKLLHFGVQTVLSNIVGIILYRIDILMIGYFMTPTEVGIYSVAVGIARTIWIIPKSINTVSYPTFSYYWGKRDFKTVKKLFDKCIKYTACILMPISLGMTIFGKDLILLLFKTSFISAVLPLQILLIGAVIRGVIISIGSIWLSAGRPDMGYKLPLITVVPNILLNYTLIPAYGIEGAAIATILSFLFNASVSLFFINQILKLQLDIKWLGKAISLTISVVLVYSYSMSINHYIMGVLTLGFYLVFLWLYLMKREDRKFVIELIKTIKKT